MDPLDVLLVETQEQARDLAIEWQNWFGERSMSWGEVAEWSSAFETLGEKFDLTDEFRENGII